MLFDPKYEDRLGRLEEQLQRAGAVTPDLLSDVIARACVRFPSLDGAAKIRVDRLIEAGAFTDAALTLIELELPHWKLRRLVLDDGEWICSLSREPWLPLGLDDAAEAHHESLPLAVLIALLRVRRAASPRDARAVTVPQVRPRTSQTVCCDNFS
jgi:hypothetical protein